MEKATAIQNATERTAEMRRLIMELEEKVSSKEREAEQRQREFESRLAREHASYQEKIELLRQRDEGYAKSRVMTERSRASAEIGELRAMVAEAEGQLRLGEQQSLQRVASMEVGSPL